MLVQITSGDWFIAFPMSDNCFGRKVNINELHNSLERVFLNKSTSELDY